MKRSLPVSALLTGLMALPGIGLAPPAAGQSQQQAAEVRAFPAEMPAAVEAEIRRLARAEELDAFGMQDLERRLARMMQERLAGILKRAGQE